MSAHCSSVSWHICTVWGIIGKKPGEQIFTMPCKLPDVGLKHPWFIYIHTPAGMSVTGEWWMESFRAVKSNHWEWISPRCGAGVFLQACSVCTLSWGDGRLLPAEEREREKSWFLKYETVFVLFKSATRKVGALNQVLAWLLCVYFLLSYNFEIVFDLHDPVDLAICSFHFKTPKNISWSMLIQALECCM